MRPEEPYQNNLLVAQFLRELDGNVVPIAEFKKAERSFCKIVIFHTFYQLSQEKLRQQFCRNKCL